MVAWHEWWRAWHEWWRDTKGGMDGCEGGVLLLPDGFDHSSNCRRRGLLTLKHLTCHVSQGRQG